MKVSNETRNLEEVNISIQINDKKREIQKKAIEEWKTKVKDQIRNKLKKSIKEKSPGDKTGIHVS